MTSHMVYEWQYNYGIWPHTHGIYVITPTWLMISHPMYVWYHTHYMKDTLDTIYDITPSRDDIIQFFLCNSNHYVYDIISNIYDVTHTVCMTTQAVYLNWNQFYLPSHPKYMSSDLLCWRHRTNYVIYHRWHIYAIICTIHDIISSVYDNNH